MVAPTQGYFSKIAGYGTVVAGAVSAAAKGAAHLAQSYCPPFSVWQRMVGSSTATQAACTAIQEISPSIISVAAPLTAALACAYVASRFLNMPSGEAPATEAVSNDAAPSDASGDQQAAAASAGAQRPSAQVEDDVKKEFSGGAAPPFSVENPAAAALGIQPPAPPPALIPPFKSAAIPPALPILRSAAVEERRLLGNPRDPINFVAVPLLNQGNTCFGASVAQGALFPREAALRAKAWALRQSLNLVNDPDVAREFEIAERLIGFIDAYREKAARILEKGKQNIPLDETDGLDISPFMETLREFDPDSKREYEQYLQNSTSVFVARIENRIASYQKALQELEDEAATYRLLIGEQPDLAEQLAETEGNIEDTKRLLQLLEEYSEKEEVNFPELSSDLSEIGFLDLLGAPPQQDAYQIIGALDRFIYGENFPVKRQDFAGVALAPGDRLVRGEVFADPAKYPFNFPQSEEATRLPVEADFVQELVDVEEIDKETNEKKTVQKSVSYFRVAPGQRFDRLVQNAFFEQNPEPCRFTVERNGVLDNAYPSYTKRALLSTAPDTWTFMALRHRSVGNVAYAVRGPIEGIQEILEVPGEYFADGRPATMRLDAILLQSGGNQAKSGHYRTYVRKFDPDTLDTRWTSANDGLIAGLTQAMIDAIPHESYILIYKKIG